MNNSLWLSDTIRRQGAEWTLAQVMACCLTAPSHYLYQSWLIISKAPWHSLEGIRPISKTRLKIPFSELHLDIPGANALKYNSFIIVLHLSIDTENLTWHQTIAGNNSQQSHTIFCSVGWHNVKVTRASLVTDGNYCQGNQGQRKWGYICRS